jgi:hypothetical protein
MLPVKKHKIDFVACLYWAVTSLCALLLLGGIISAALHRP